MCAEPDFSTNRDQTLCGKRDAGTVFVQLGAHWLIATCRKVRLDARRLISSGTSARRTTIPADSGGVNQWMRVREPTPLDRLIDHPQGQEIRYIVHSLLRTRGAPADKPTRSRHE
jgi:hypothetical protein